MSKTLFGIVAGAIICFAITIPVLADELKITVGVENGDKKTEVLGADIYANIDGRLTEIAVTPDGSVPFKMNLKAGALRLKSFWITRKQLTEKDFEEAPVTPTEEVK